MPFLSKAQSKKCFVTKGFGGKVDCEEWARKTDYKSIPDKIKKSKIKRKSFKEWLELKEKR